jgi:CO/xanthine dehydrogenase Mo-binding subunit
LPLDKVHVIQGDTLALAEGGGTIASRTAVVVGSAVNIAATKVRERTLRLAADALEANVGDLSLAEGAVRVAGSPDRFVSLGQLARSVSPGSGRQGPDGEGPLRAEATFQPTTVTFANGIHAAVVELDEATGLVRVLRYVVVHDCGKVINPLIVDGQVRGGVAQGIGGALTEELVYDENGQLLSGTFMDYGVPRSVDVPPIEVVHLETPSERNPLGIKGVGEAGTIAAAAAIAGAIEDALERRVHPTTYPFTPEAVMALVEDAASAAQQEGALRQR